LKRLRKIIKKTRGMTLGQLSAESFLRIRRKTSTVYRRLVDTPENSYITDQQLDQSLKKRSVAEVAERIRKNQQGYLTAGLKDLSQTAELIKQLFPASVDETLREADAIRAHKIKIFGCTWQLSEPIDWHIDPETSARWPLEHYTRLPLIQGNLSDVRAVWEVNRLQHLMTLGRAYAFTGDERYTEAFVRQLTSWYEANPPRFGVNWTVAMEAAIRAVSISAALVMFRVSPRLTDAVFELILKILLAHGRFIRTNLEFSHRISSNHYLSDLIGLFVIGTTVPEFKEAGAWVRFSTKELLREMQHQVLPDGVSFETSIGYHRLALEIFLLFFVVSQSRGVRLPEEFSQRLEKMFDFVRAYLKPDNCAPIIGDSDDGRIIPFKEREATDHSYLLSIAAVLFNKEEFKPTNRIDDEALWWFGQAGYNQFDLLATATQSPNSQGFREAQLFIQRRDLLYAIIDCGDHGIHGRGSHAHSDALSFELFAFDQTFLRDPGTFVYTASKRWRHQFRSTAYHNTVRIDGQEISEINRDHPFILGANVLPKINLWQSTENRDVLDAQHPGYLRLAEPVTHRRILTFDKRESYWVLEDQFTGKGSHLFELFFNFDAGLKIGVDESGRVMARGKTSALAIVPVSNHAFETKRTNRWVAPSYRTRLRASGIIYRLRATVPLINRFLLIPFRLEEEWRVVELSNQFADGGE
jgi:hypothetical protein